MNINRNIVTNFAAASAAFALPLCAATEVVDGVEWMFSVENGEATIVNLEDSWEPAMSPPASGSVVIPSTLGGCPVTSIGGNAFLCCNLGGSTVTIPEGVRRVEWHAFGSCGLGGLVLPDSLEYVGGYAFADNCLESVAIPTKVSYLDEDAFYCCGELSSISVSPDNGSYRSEDGVVFSKDGTELVVYPDGKPDKSYTIPSDVKIIGRNAFRGNYKIETVYTGDDVEIIRSGAFDECGFLRQIHLGAGVAEFNFSGLFEHFSCPSLEAFSVDAGNANFKSRDGVLFSGNGETLLFVPTAKSGTYSVPSDVTRIDDFAFQDCERLASIIVPDSVTSIGENAFDYCIGLTDLYLPKLFEGKTGSMGIPDGCAVVFYSGAKPSFYKVAFSANGGKGTMAAQTIARGANTALSANKFTKSGCTFIGWAKTKTGAVAYANKASVKNLAAADKSVTLYAQWAVTKYSVKFNANGGALPKGKTMAAQTMTYGKAAALRKNVFTRSGYVFLGWAKTKTGAVAYKNGQSVKNLRADGKATTLYAVWAKKTYKVAFYANGGTGKMAVESFTYGKAKKLTANKFKAPKGKKFAGWATSAANAKKGKVAYKNAQAVKNLVTTGKTVKLYAVWKKK